MVEVDARESGSQNHQARRQLSMMTFGQCECSGCLQGGVGYLDIAATSFVSSQAQPVKYQWCGVLTHFKKDGLVPCWVPQWLKHPPTPVQGLVC